MTRIPHINFAQKIKDGLIPAPRACRCPAGCTLTQTIQCWQRRARELRRDLAEAVRQESTDVEVLRCDLAVAGRLLDVLIAYGATGNVRVPA